MIEYQRQRELLIAHAKMAFLETMERFTAEHGELYGWEWVRAVNDGIVQHITTHELKQLWVEADGTEEATDG